MRGIGFPHWAVASRMAERMAFWVGAVSWQTSRPEADAIRRINNRYSAGQGTTTAQVASCAGRRCTTMVPRHQESRP